MRKDVSTLAKGILSNFNMPKIASDNFKMFPIVEMDRLRTSIIIADNNQTTLTEVTIITGIETEDKETINRITIIISLMASRGNMLSHVEI